MVPICQGLFSPGIFAIPIWKITWLCRAKSPLMVPPLISPYYQCRLIRSEEHTSELQSRGHLVCRLLLEKKKEDNENPHRPEHCTETPLLHNPRNRALGRRRDIER